jgi:flagellar assembly factor FliW
MTIQNNACFTTQLYITEFKDVSVTSTIIMKKNEEKTYLNLNANTKRKSQN